MQGGRGHYNVNYSSTNSFNITTLTQINEFLLVGPTLFDQLFETLRMYIILLSIVLSLKIPE